MCYRLSYDKERMLVYIYVNARLLGDVADVEVVAEPGEDRDVVDLAAEGEAEEDDAPLKDKPVGN
jgi:hypothetical protein